MSIELLSFLFVAVFVVILLTGLPLAFATGAVAVFFAVVLFGLPGLTLIVGRVFTLMGNYVLLSVPLFIFMACVLEQAGIAEAIFRAAHVWAGQIRGGLAVAVIISCALMAAMVGVIGAEIVTMGVVALPAMLSRGYKKELALGCICAGGGLATLIPPSVVFIMYGLTAGVSIGQLYVAGVIPGLMLAAMYIAYIVIRCKMRPDFAPPASAERARDLAAPEVRAAEGADPARPRRLQRARLALPRLGDAHRGGRRRRRRRRLRDGLERQAQLGQAAPRRRGHGQGHGDAVLALLRLVGADRRLHAGRRHQADPGRADRAAGRADRRRHPDQIIWIILGCFIDWIGILLLTAPIFVPVVVALGFDPVWMGVLFCMNMQISYISPPFGPAAFYLKGVTPPGITLVDIFRSIWPYLGLQVVALGLVIAFPQIALWLPGTMAR